MKSRPLFRLSASSMSPAWLTVRLENFRASIRGTGVTFSHDSEEMVFAAREGANTCQFKNKARGLWLYRNGVQRRGKSLFHSYCLQNIEFEQDDVVIDIGANSGDLSLELRKRIRPENYVAIEPNPVDFEMLSLNAPRDAKLIRKALGPENATLDFFVATEEADSSLIEPVHYDAVIPVEVTRFDTLIDELQIDRIKLVKVEAEGFEPEILSGFGDKIKICDYIAVDGGYERGKDQEQTLTEVTNFLLGNDFEMIDINFSTFRALYRRKR